MSSTFQVHHRVRILRRSELEADLDTQEDGENESLSKNTFDKIVKQKQKEGMSIAESKSLIYDPLLEWKVEVILTAHSTKVNSCSEMII